MGCLCLVISTARETANIRVTRKTWLLKMCPRTFSYRPLNLNYIHDIPFHNQNEARQCIHYPSVTQTLLAPTRFAAKSMFFCIEEPKKKAKSQYHFHYKRNKSTAFQNNNCQKNGLLSRLIKPEERLHCYLLFSMQPRCKQRLKAFVRN